MKHSEQALALGELSWSLSHHYCWLCQLIRSELPGENTALSLASLRSRLKSFSAGLVLGRMQEGDLAP